ncbi:hypothetical protein D9611_000320 [Ephemerocybe angulata]|uniref:Uncharacterized protein n=1 Tax=Ephemerocybe angulata TaxID=980116 RepID=A0A8H5BPC1_9AGAR|nr:hypothetical protein D9611_000320 [Tulosesus angulatus]
MAALPAARSGVIQEVPTIAAILLQYRSKRIANTQGSNTLLVGVFASFLASVTVAMSIMVYAAIYEHREFNTRSPLLVTFYRDGIFYFISLAAFASANIVIIWIAPAGYQFLFTQFQINFHGILSTRMLLHLRHAARMELNNSWLARLPQETWTKPTSVPQYLPRSSSPVRLRRDTIRDAQPTASADPVLRDSQGV